MQAGPPPDTLNLTHLRLHYQRQFLKYFDELPGSKTLFIDSSIIKPLSFIIGSLPESANVVEKMVLSNRIFEPNCSTIVFVVRPEI